MYVSTTDTPTTQDRTSLQPSKLILLESQQNFGDEKQVPHMPISVDVISGRCNRYE